MDNEEIKRLLEDFVKKVIQSETKDCFRVYKAKVTTAPNGTLCGVTLVGDQTELMLPYSSRLSNLQVGTIVFVATIFGSFRNAFVWETISTITQF
jgi:hypothetical protein